MSLLRRFWRCLMENGPCYTVLHMWSRLTLWLRKKIVMPNYYDDLRNRINNYQKRYPVTPRQTAVRLIWWNFKALLKKHSAAEEKKEKNILKKEKQTDQPKRIKLQLDPKKIHVAFLIRGGMGDYLIQINYIYQFYLKYSCSLLSIDIFTRRSFQTAEAILHTEGDSFVNGLFPEEGYTDNFPNYDLFIDLSRYPNVKRHRMGRIAEHMPQLLDYIYSCEKFRAEHERFFKYAGSTDGQSAMLCIVAGKKRIQQPDVYEFLGVTEDYKFTISTYYDAETLEKFGIGARPYLTIHRGCDAYYTKDSVKLWPVAYYQILIGLLKRKYPDLLIVQLGVSRERCPALEGVDIDLVEKTSLEDIKVLLKHSTLHIDGEGGMVHLRHALKGGISVVIFGPTSAEFFGYSENVNIVGAGCPTWCEWTIHNWQEKCVRGEPLPPCMHSIVPEMVMERIEAIFREAGGNIGNR
ncbi:MAG: glycosyltransferase family 9 protein [Clostridiaceae bacterium]|nr:glycosyltransferase family 9 protein [Clostridiaceae bacterium]